MSYEGTGFCPICETLVTFKSAGDRYRDQLLCPSCHSVVRERALALILEELAPNWRSLAIHESSPARRGISVKLAREAGGYVASQYFRDHPLGTLVNGWRNENLERQTLHDESFHLVISLDVMEHVFHPGDVYREIYRTLKPGGHYIHTFPINKGQVEAARARAEPMSDGTVRHLAGKPAYHGNPVSDEGSLVTFHYGYDIAPQIADWAPFDVRIVRFWDRWHGIMGDYTEVVVCTKTAKK